MAQASEVLTAEELRGWRERVVDSPLSPDDAAVIDELRVIEELKCALEARHARLTVGFDASQRRKAADAGEPQARCGRGIAAQVALARRISPRRAQQLVGLAKVLSTEMPHTMAAFTAGRLSEWRATILARETACLERDDRLRIDVEIAGDPDRVEKLGDRQLGNAARARAVELDNAAVARRRARAASERRVTIRPAPDSMVYLTALLPMAQGVAASAALTAATDTAFASGQATSRGQAMADALVGRVTGSTTTSQDGRPLVPVEVQVVMSADALLDGADRAATIPGHGPVSAGLARSLVADALDAGLRVRIRRLFARPTTGELVAMESRSRLFPAGLQTLIRLRDQFCRNAWCGARIRHLDHVRGYAEDGPTAAANAQGLCEGCNHAKQARGWTQRVVENPPEGRHTVEVTTPTGHTYESTAPPMIPPESPIRTDARSAQEPRAPDARSPAA